MLDQKFTMGKFRLAGSYMAPISYKHWSNRSGIRGLASLPFDCDNDLEHNLQELLSGDWPYPRIIVYEMDENPDNNIYFQENTDRSSDWINIGYAPRPRGRWQFFWYSWHHGRLMRYPFLSVLKFCLKWTFWGKRER